MSMGKLEEVLTMARLGHSSAKTTLQVCGRLFPDEEDRTRQALEEAFADDESDDDDAANDAERGRPVSRHAPGAAKPLVGA
jgi:hypothetical protein